ncbi:MAG: amidophosphoribosyltransferase [Oscillospiraceae bacterium]|jgi:amidophosphoribosyltransferase|nr:amidophosphoribosyltransferase [Oscillospiraceae bacterium]
MAANDKPREECAVFGVNVTVPEAAGIAYNGLLALQHRGQEGAGIAAVCSNRIVCRKGVGLVSEVFSGERLGEFAHSNVAVGHARYSTTGGNTPENVGPFVTEYLTGRIVIAHNGNVTNALELREWLMDKGLRFYATSDSEVVSALCAYMITKERGTVRGIIAAAGMMRGAFSLVAASGKNKLIAVRDGTGFRPLCIGRNASGYAVASESCAFDACGFELAGDVLPGEVVVIENGEITRREVALAGNEPGHGFCIFEYVYFSRPDSIINGLSVYKARYNMGLALAREYPVRADVVCGVPDSGLDAACGYSAESGIPQAAGFVKNRYIGRSFIYPTQTERDSAVRLKLNPLLENIGGKRVVLVDDSIVRGTTIEKIVKSLKNAGAVEVHMRVSSPPFYHPCHYGTDIDSEENLIATKMGIGEIARAIGADSLGYISIDGMRAACAGCSLPFCTACFTGNRGLSRPRKEVLEQEAI